MPGDGLTHCVRLGGLHGPGVDAVHLPAQTQCAWDRGDVEVNGVPCSGILWTEGEARFTAMGENIRLRQTPLPSPARWNPGFTGTLDRCWNSPAAQSGDGSPQSKGFVVSPANKHPADSEVGGERWVVVDAESAAPAVVVRPWEANGGWVATTHGRFMGMRVWRLAVPGAEKELGI